MISKNKLKLIKSLEIKKFRSETGLFIAEGNKIVSEILGSHIIVEELLATGEFLGKADLSRLKDSQIMEVDDDEIRKASFLKNPQQCLAICRIPQYQMSDAAPVGSLAFYLDTIQDPGNLGTIVRLADWFGMKEIYCSPGTADIYGPKSVQSTMGAICRVKAYYADPLPFLERCAQAELSIYGTFLNGISIYEAELEQKGIIVLGNEGQGISREVESFIGRRLTIPRYPEDTESSESLNVSIAAAIVCSEFRRRGLHSK